MAVLYCCSCIPSLIRALSPVVYCWQVILSDQQEDAPTNVKSAPAATEKVRAGLWLTLHANQTSEKSKLDP